MDLSPSRPGSIVVPSVLTWAGTEPVVTFSELDVACLAEPFWHQSLARAHRIVGLASLDTLDRDVGDLRLAGAIHHMTRCGSTLLVRQFSALPDTIAISEPFVFQHLLEGPAAAPEVTRRRLRLLAVLHRDALAPIADRWVVKWSSLLCLHALRMAEAFPEVPAIFLHRDGLQVLTSIARAPLGGLQFLEARHLREPVDADEFARIAAHPMELWARTIAASCRAIADVPGVRALDYADLPSAGWEHVGRYFGFDLDADARAAMRNVSAYHSKNGQAYGVEDAARWPAADMECEVLAANFVEPARQAAVKNLSELLG